MNIRNAFKAYDLKNIFDILDKYGQEAMILAGGTDLMVEIKEEKNRGSIILDISDVDELKGISIEGNKITMGALTTFTDIVENDFIKANLLGLFKAAKVVGSPQIRNMGTIGGNICNGASAADIVPPLLALDAKLNLESSKGKRIVKLKDFYNNGNRKTELRENEILQSINFDWIKEGNRYITFSKLGYRNALAISRISCSVYADILSNEVRDIRIASGALGRYPLREYSLEDYMIGKSVNDNLIQEAAVYFSRNIEKRLKGRSSCEYKKEAVKGVFKRAMEIESLA